jgi:hypothetical protein
LPVIGVKRGHVLPVRFKRQYIFSGQSLRQIGFGQSAFATGYNQGAFGGIALNSPTAVFGHQPAVVADHTGHQALVQRWKFSLFSNGLARLQHIALRIVAAPADRKPLGTGPNFLNRHLILGECSGLVRADDGCASQCFHRRKLSNNCTSAGHAANPDGQRNRDGGRQPLGYGPDSQGYGGHEHIQNRVVLDHAYDERQSRQGDNHIEQHMTEFGDALGQRGLQFDHLGNEVGNTARLGFVARGDNDSLPLPVGDQRSRIRHVGTLRQDGFLRKLAGRFLDRNRFSGKRRFVDLHVPHFDQAHVRRHLVAGLEPNNVARHDILGGHPNDLPVPEHRSFGSDDLPQGLDRRLCLGFLEKPDYGVDQDHRHDDSGVDPLLKQGGD